MTNLQPGDSKYLTRVNFYILIRYLILQQNAIITTLTRNTITSHTTCSKSSTN